MAEIVEIHRASIFDSTCQTLVNTVNCVGIMGKGIALEYKMRFPSMYEQYHSICEKKLLRPGTLMLYKESIPWILNFPTKDHWKNPSKLEYIHSGLQKLANTYQSKGITSIAFPKLGTTSGKLNWQDVKELLFQYLTPLKNLQIEIYHFDPNSKDSFFDRFYQKVHRFAVDDYVEILGVKRKQAILIHQSMLEGSLSNMVNLQSIEGIGDKTIEAIYNFILKSENRAVTSAEKQMSLF